MDSSVYNIKQFLVAFESLEKDGLTVQVQPLYGSNYRDLLTLVANGQIQNLLPKEIDTALRSREDKSPRQKIINFLKRKIKNLTAQSQNKCVVDFSEAQSTNMANLNLSQDDVDEAILDHYHHTDEAVNSFTGPVLFGKLAKVDVLGGDLTWLDIDHHIKQNKEEFKISSSLNSYAKALILAPKLAQKPVFVSTRKPKNENQDEALGGEGSKHSEMGGDSIPSDAELNDLEAEEQKPPKGHLPRKPVTQMPRRKPFPRKDNSLFASKKKPKGPLDDLNPFG